MPLFAVQLYSFQRWHRSAAGFAYAYARTAHDGKSLQAKVAKATETQADDEHRKNADDERISHLNSL